MTPQLLVFAIYVLLFNAIIYFDWSRHKIYNKMLFPGMAFALGYALTTGNIWNALLGGVVGLGLMLYGLRVNPGGIGMGDIKLGALVGMILGFPLVFWSIAGTMIAGGVAAVIVKLRGKPIKELPLGVTMSIMTVGILAVTFPLP